MSKRTRRTNELLATEPRRGTSSLQEAGTRLNKSIIISLLSIGIALLSVVSAIQSNRIAERANRLAQEANDLVAENNQIARDANIISLDDSGAQIRIPENQSAYPMYVYACKGRLPGSFGVFARFEDLYYVTNTGGRSASLVEAELTGRDLTFVVEPYQGQATLELPLDIEAGTTRKWRFRAFGSSNTQLSEESARQVFGRIRSSPPLTWTFRFGDGQEVVREMPVWTSSPGFDANSYCDDEIQAWRDWVYEKQQ